MTTWLRFDCDGRAGFGTLDGDFVDEHEGDLFGEPLRTGRRFALSDVKITLPCRPSKFLALWNNDHAQAEKQGLSIPEEPLYFIKAGSSYLAHGQTIETPPGYDGRVVYEGELGLVIGKVGRNLNLEEAEQAIFGVTCVNDVTAIDLLNKDPSFAQWTRAKGFDTFGAFGPAIVTGLDVRTLRVRTLVNGRERQNFPCSGMIFSPAQIVSAISRCMTLMPGDLIACGTSSGVLPMKPGTVVEVIIDGVGTLRNTYGPAPITRPLIGSPIMRICVVGAGAIGGMLGVKLALSGHEVTLILRGANLEAVRQNGMKLIEEDGKELLARPARVTSVIAEAGVQDVVILGMKAHQVAAIAAELPAIMHERTRVVTMQNGIPWWYFHKLPGAWEGTPIRAVDPDGVIAQSIAVDRVIGSVVYPASEVIQPGIIKVIEGNRFTLGELDGGDTPSIREIADAFKTAGFKAPISRDIRSEIWLKVWGNLSFNPISALTHATLEDICLYAPTRELAAAMMREAQTIGEALGVQFKVSLEKRIAGAQAVGQHKTSMLQDVEQGRPLELQALVASVMELGRITQKPTPTIDAVYALTSLLANTLQQHKATLRLA
jgi:ketopantoate reductase/2-keto-4-pentenoate hydratase/2-oxohepta-3-ene-1,7-dioic acid hydratase in catechol pathway